jgi:hypothetical protein
MNEQQTSAIGALPTVSRRRFIGYAGALAGVGLLAGGIACKKEEDPLAGTIDLGTGDIGVLNLGYAIAQVQAAFYTQVLISPYTPLKSTDTEYKILLDMRDHEIAHRELYRKTLSGGAIKDLTPNFSGVLFNKRTSVLDTAKFFEDLSVSAYNGTAKLLSTDPFLELCAKISAVEARHAAAVRDLIQMGTFTEYSFVDGNGLDFLRDPKGILFLLNAYITEPLNANNLPTS